MLLYLNIFNIRPQGAEEYLHQDKRSRENPCYFLSIIAENKLFPVS